MLIYTANATVADLHAMLAKVQTQVQRRAAILAKRQALPFTDPARNPLIRLACLELERHQVAQERIIQKIKEAEIREAEQASEQAQEPATVADLKAEVMRLRGQLALIARSERCEEGAVICDFDTLQGVARAALAKPKDAQALEDARREARVAHGLLQRALADRTSALARLNECAAAVIRHRGAASEAQAKLRMAEHLAGL